MAALLARSQSRVRRSPVRGSGGDFGAFGALSLRTSLYSKAVQYVAMYSVAVCVCAHRLYRNGSILFSFTAAN